MKKLLLLLSTLLLSAALFAADPATGLWKSIDDKTGEVTAIWRIYEENGKLFGTIAATTSDPQDVIASACKDSYVGFPVSGSVNKMKIVGTPWIFNMEKETDGFWINGNIIDPSNGKMYGCIIKYLNKDDKHKKFTAKEPTLAMAGTVGPIQVFQYWVKATEADVKAAKEKNPPKNK